MNSHRGVVALIRDLRNNDPSYDYPFNGAPIRLKRTDQDILSHSDTGGWRSGVNLLLECFH